MKMSMMLTLKLVVALIVMKKGSTFSPPHSTLSHRRFGPFAGFQPHKIPHHVHVTPSICLYRVSRMMKSNNIDDINNNDKEKNKENNGNENGNGNDNIIDDDKIPEYNDDANPVEFFSHKSLYKFQTREVLETEQKAMKDLVKDFETVGQFLRSQGTFKDLKSLLFGISIKPDVIQEYYEKATKDISKLLDNEIVVTYGRSEAEEINKLKKDFLGRCVSVNSPTNKATPGYQDLRDRDIHLVLGSSGSGKTSFAVNVLATKSDMKLKNDENLLTVYHCCSASFLTNKEKKTSQEVFFDELLEIVKEKIYSKVKDSGADRGGSNKFPIENLNMALILDEAYEWKTVLSTVDSLKRVQEIFGKNILADNCRIRLIVAGTGYDTIAKSFSSRSDVFKHRTRPWSDESAFLWAEKLYNENKQNVPPNEIKTCLDRFPILAQLASNARAATFLINPDNNEEFRILYNNQPAAGVDIVGELIRSVANCYENSNGLKSKTTAQQKQIAMAAFKVLDESWRNRSKDIDNNNVPDIATYLKYDLIGAALGLIECNYEYADESMEILDPRYASITVSPALTVVLYYLMGIPAPIFGGWQAFEVIGALSCFRRFVLEDCNNTKQLMDEHAAWTKYNVMTIRQAVPAGASGQNFQVPNLDKYTIWVNGPRAPFADYVGFYTLGQCKFVSNPATSATVRIEEFKKLGALKLNDDDEDGDGDEIETNNTNTDGNGALDNDKGVKGDSIRNDDKKSMTVKIYRRAILLALESVWSRERQQSLGQSSRMEAVAVSPKAYHWGEDVKKDEGEVESDESHSQTTKGWMYPEDQLTASGKKDLIDMVECSIVNSDSTDGNKNIELSFGSTNTKTVVELDESKIGKWKIEFVTNSNSIILSPNTNYDSKLPKVTKVKVERKDVDVNGVCTNDAVKQWLSTNIDTDHFEVYFFFAESRKEK